MSDFSHQHQDFSPVWESGFTHAEDSPETLLHNWLDFAQQQGEYVNEAALATADKQPTVRMVLLKQFSCQEITFFTQNTSEKAQQLATNPFAEILLYWRALHRQIRLRGTTRKLDQELANAYALSRPYQSQLANIASIQGSPLSSRQELIDKVNALHKKYPTFAPPNPRWCGFSLSPQTIEFWQGQPNRLHERLQYQKLSKGWQKKLLQP